MDALAEEVFNLSVAVAEFIQTYADPVQQREVEVRQRRAVLVRDVAATTQSGRRAARDQDGKIFVVVHAGVAHPAAIQVDRVIEERAVALGRGLQLLEKLREQ